MRLEKKQREEEEEARLKEERRKREEEDERKRKEEEEERRRKREAEEEEERKRKLKLLDEEAEEERRRKKKREEEEEERARKEKKKREEEEEEERVRKEKKKREEEEEEKVRKEKKKREEEEEEERRRRKQREEAEEEEKARKEKKKLEEKEKKRKREEQRKLEEAEEEERRKREKKRREEEEEEEERRRRERRRKEREEEEEVERKRMEVKRKELESLNSLRRESTLGLARKQQLAQSQQQNSIATPPFDENAFEEDEMTPHFGLEAFEDKMFQTEGRQSRRGGGGVDFASILGADDVGALERELDFDLEDASQWSDAPSEVTGTFSPRDSFASNAPNRMSRRSVTTNANNGQAQNSPIKRSNTQRLAQQQQPPKPSVMQTQIPQQEFERLLQFLQPVGVEYAAVFAREAVDLEVMLLWDDPETELKEMGITQRGVLFKLTKLIKDLQKELKPMDIYERDKVTQLGIKSRFVWVFFIVFFILLFFFCHLYI
jgi:hypothetical protein